MLLCRSFTLLGAVLLPLLSGVAHAYTSASEPRSWKSIEQVLQRRLYSFAEANAVADV